MKQHVIFALAIIVSLGIMSLVTPCQPPHRTMGALPTPAPMVHAAAGDDLVNDDGSRPDMEQEYRGRALPSAQPTELQRNHDRDVDGMNEFEF